MQFIKKQKLNTGPARNATHNVAGGPTRITGGFTLVETLVAISIFTGAILGLLSFSAGSIGDNTYAKNKLVATYLAQEGLEYMRNLRDTYTLFESNGWTSFVRKLDESECDTELGCYFDPEGLDYGDQTLPMTDLVITPCDATCPTMFYSESEDLTINKYNYDPTGLPTTFTRKIKVSNMVGYADFESNKEILIESTVSWKKGDKTFTVSFSNYFKNWEEFI